MVPAACSPLVQQFTSFEFNGWEKQMIECLVVGICGGFTTFSSFALETGDLMKNGNVGIAMLYAGLSITVGTIAVFAGQAIFR